MDDRQNRGVTDAETTVNVAQLAADLRDADSAVAFTGAGVSTASGIPDFRSESGVWNRFDPENFRYDRFRADPAGFWEDRVELHETMFERGVERRSTNRRTEPGEKIEPNPAHDALDALAESGHLAAIVTQNTDGLHAGTPAELVELHGNAHRVACESCGRRADAGPVRERVRSGDLPPRCGDCDGLLKPDVVLFGERLPEGALAQARTWAERADVFLAAGSSLTVEPAASLPRTAARAGATTAVCNLDSTPFSSHADYDLRGDVTDLLPALRDAVSKD